jgi:cytochrome c biogenesis factor
MALWISISATLFRRAVLTLWHAFLFLGLLGFFLFSSFCLVASPAFSCKKIDVYRHV